jgi:hypothetical protein
MPALPLLSISIEILPVKYRSENTPRGGLHKRNVHKKTGAKSTPDAQAYLELALGSYDGRFLIFKPQCTPNPSHRLAMMTLDRTLRNLKQERDLSECTPLRTKQQDLVFPPTDHRFDHVPDLRQANRIRAAADQLGKRTQLSAALQTV